MAECLCGKCKALGLIASIAKSSKRKKDREMDRQTNVESRTHRQNSIHNYHGCCLVVSEFEAHDFSYEGEKNKEMAAQKPLYH